MGERRCRKKERWRSDFGGIEFKHALTGRRGRRAQPRCIDDRLTKLKQP